MATDREQVVAANRARLLAVDALPPVPAHMADAVFRPADCPGCDYPLTGMPAAGRCPECGRGYGPPDVWLDGTAAGTLALPFRIALSRRTGWAGLLATPFLAVALLHTPLADVVIGHRSRWPWAGVGLFVAIGIWLRQVRSPPVRVVLTPDGVMQAMRGSRRATHGRVNRADLIPWRSVRGVRLSTLSDGRLHVWLGAGRDPWHGRWEFVNALVQYPPEAVAALQQRVVGWRAEAADGGRTNPPLADSQTNR